MKDRILRYEARKNIHRVNVEVINKLLRVYLYLEERYIFAFAVSYSRLSDISFCEIYSLRESSDYVNEIALISFYPLLFHCLQYPVYEIWKL